MKSKSDKSQSADTRHSRKVLDEALKVKMYLDGSYETDYEDVVESVKFLEMRTGSWEPSAKCSTRWDEGVLALATMSLERWRQMEERTRAAGWRRSKGVPELCKYWFDEQIFMGGGERSERDCKRLRSMLKTALTYLSGQQQNGLQGAEYDVGWEREAQASMEAIVANIGLAITGKIVTFGEKAAKQKENS